MGRTVKPDILAKARPLVAQGKNGTELAKALKLKSARDGRWYRAQVLAEAQGQAATNGQGEAPLTEDVPLEKIRFDGQTTARVAINGHLINEYAEARREGAQFPPPVLFRDAEGHYWIGDGHHRCRAEQLVGSETIKAEVREGGEREAFLYACGANVTHGLRRDALDKRHVVMILLMDEEWGQWSDRELARLGKVSHTFVGKIRAERDQRRADRDERLTGNVASERTYTTKHGTVATMDTTRIGFRAAPPAPTNGQPAEAPSPPPTNETPAAEPTDELTRWRADYPEFIHPAIPLEDFRTIAEALDAMPADDRHALIARWRETRDQNILAELLGLPPLPETPPVIKAAREGGAAWDSFFHQLSVLASSIAQHWPEMREVWPVARKQTALARVRQYQATLADIEAQLAAEVEPAILPAESAAEEPPDGR